MQSKLIFIVVALLFLCNSAKTQERFSFFSAPLSDSLGKERTTAIGFERLSNTFRWNFNGNYEHHLNDFSIALKENFRSTVIRAQNNFVKDEQLLFAKTSYRITEKIIPEIQFTSFLLNDNQTIGISNVSSHFLYGGMQYQPFSFLTLEPLLGYRFDNQRLGYDEGMTYHFGVSAPFIDMEGFQTKLSGQFQRDNLHPRLLEDHFFNTELQKKFEGRTMNNASFSFLKNRREFYLPNNSGIDKRTEQIFSFADVLEYEISNDIVFGAQGGVFSRSIQKTTGIAIDELKLETSGALHYAFADSFSTSLRLHYFERNEQHAKNSDDGNAKFFNESSLEEQQNNFSKRTMLSGGISFPFSTSDEVEVQASGSILRYDTPSKENVEDRDELVYVASARTKHRISPFLLLKIITDATATHLVYLLAERSANNFWNRTLRLSPVIEFTPHKYFTSVNQFEVLANYTIYDFEEFASGEIRSFSFRQVAFVDSSSLSLTNNVSLVWFSSVKMYERGELHWQEFSERPINFFEEWTVIPRIQLQKANNLQIAAGVRFFRKMQFAGSDDTRKLERMFTSVGPLAFIDWNVGEHAQLTINGWHEFQYKTKTERRRNTNFSLLLKWNP